MSWRCVDFASLLLRPRVLSPAHYFLGSSTETNEPPWAVDTGTKFVDAPTHNSKKERIWPSR